MSATAKETTLRQELIDWARQVIDLTDPPNPGRQVYISMLHGLEHHDDYAPAEMLVRNLCNWWALRRCGFEQSDNGCISEVPVLTTEEDQIAVQNVQRFANWLIRMRPAGMAILGDVDAV